MKWLSASLISHSANPNQFGLVQLWLIFTCHCAGPVSITLAKDTSIAFKHTLFNGLKKMTE